MTLTQQIAALDLEIKRLSDLCDCDCDNDDCVRCSHYPTILENKRKERAVLAAVQAPAEVEPVKPLVFPSRCDGVEQDAFEDWAASEGYDMTTHPLHWLFLDERTSAARSGWAAGLIHAVKRIEATLDTNPVTVQDAARVPEIAALIDAAKHHAETLERHGLSGGPVADIRAALRAITQHTGETK